MHEDRQRMDHDSDARLMELLREFHADIPIPGGEQAWESMHARLSDRAPLRRKARWKRRSRLGLGASAAGSLLLVYLLFGGVNHVKALTAYFMKPHQGIGVTSVEFGNYDGAERKGMLTAPPPEKDMYGYVGEGFTRTLAPGETPSAPVQDPSGGTEVLTLDQAKAAASFHLGVPEYVPEGFAFKEALPVRQDPEAKSHMVTLVYERTGGPGSFSLMQIPVSGRAGSAISVAGTDIVTKEVTVRGSIGVIMIGDGHVNLRWIADSISYTLSGGLTEQEAMKIAESIR
jgi:hypothetical protein